MRVHSLWLLVSYIDNIGSIIYMKRGVYNIYGPMIVISNLDLSFNAIAVYIHECFTFNIFPKVLVCSLASRNACSKFCFERQSWMNPCPGMLGKKRCAII